MKKYRVIPLGEILNKDYDQSLIEEAFKRFSCSREKDLENFLIRKAITYEKTNFGKTHLIIDEEELDKGNFVIIAYFTIAQKSIDIGELSKPKKKKVLGEYPGRDSLISAPAYLIGQLGRCDAYDSEDLSGKQILDECYYAISVAARVVGGNIVVLECREKMFAKFYQGQLFKKLYNELNDEKLYTLYRQIDFTEFWHESRAS